MIVSSLKWEVVVNNLVSLGEDVDEIPNYQFLIPDDLEMVIGIFLLPRAHRRPFVISPPY